MAKVYNMDIVGLIQRLDRFITEMKLSVSSNGSEFSSFDQARLTDYLKNLETYLNWVVAQPQLDLPESSPREFVVAEPMPDVIVESELINDILRFFSITREEIVNCQSSRRAASLISFDETRIRSLLLKLNTFLTDYVQVNCNPMDLPESSPLVAMTPAGKKGV